MYLMTARKTSLIQGLYLTLLYCVPVLLVATIMLGNYKLRIEQVERYIIKQQEIVDVAHSIVSSEAQQQNIKDVHGYVSSNLRKHEMLDYLLKSDNADQNTKELLKYYIDYYLKPGNRSGSSAGIEAKEQIKKGIRSIWLGNSFIVLVMALTPFMLLGGGLGMSKSLPLSYSQRLQVVYSQWWMKLIISLILVYGWIYILNPSGRGASTVLQFMKTVNMGNIDTLPIFLRGLSVTPVIAGFFGWYLYLLTYFFAKMTANDVVSSQVYGIMLQKFLFTLGITIVFIQVQSEGDANGVIAENGNLVAFLLGYFPMAAFSLLKDKGITFLQGVNAQQKGQLSELPGISRWQILRLEEEGVSSLIGLGYRNMDSINLYLPNMAKVVHFWTDIARLYTIVGKDNYEKLKPYCQTSSEFIRKSYDAEFIKVISAVNISNPDEIARLLLQTYPSLQESKRL
jgi:hypothetical protein